MITQKWVDKVQASPDEGPSAVGPGPLTVAKFQEVVEPIFRGRVGPYEHWSYPTSYLVIDGVEIPREDPRHVAMNEAHARAFRRMFR